MFFRSILLFLFVGIRIILFANSLHQSSEYLLNAISSILDNKFSPNIRRIKERDTTGSLKDPANQDPISFPGNSMNQGLDLGLKINSILINFTDDEFHRVKPR